MFPYQQSLVDIPPIFHSVEFDGPFQKCQICTRELYHDGQAYIIEKVFRGPEAIIELATCLPCSMEMQSEISAESLQTIQNEFHGKVDVAARLDWLNQEGETQQEAESEATSDASSDQEPDNTSGIDADGNDADDNDTDRSDTVMTPEAIDADRWLDSCILTGTPKEDVKDFQVAGMFIGDQMVLSVFPYMISSKAIEEITEKLSKQTQGYMRDFIDTQFGMPPEFCNPESPLPLLI